MQWKPGRSLGNQVKGFTHGSQKMAMLLLGALVYLAATGGGPLERQPVPPSEGVELLRAGPRCPARPRFITCQEARICALGELRALLEPLGPEIFDKLLV